MSGVVIQFLASFLIWVLFAGLFVLWYIDGKIKKEQVVHAIVASLLAWVIAEILKYIFPTLRPFDVNGNGFGVLVKPFDPAFPSGHTALAFALSTTIFMHDKKAGWLFLICALVIGAARVIANVHYPIDILGGALIGTLVAITIEKIHFMNLVKKLSKK